MYFVVRSPFYAKQEIGFSEKVDLLLDILYEDRLDSMSMSRDLSRIAYVTVLLNVGRISYNRIKIRQNILRKEFQDFRFWIHPRSR